MPTVAYSSCLRTSTLIAMANWSREPLASRAAVRLKIRSRPSLLPRERLNKSKKLGGDRPNAEHSYQDDSKHQSPDRSAARPGTSGQENPIDHTVAHTGGFHHSRQGQHRRIALPCVLGVS